jgi:hypothetical protein
MVFYLEAAHPTQQLPSDACHHATLPLVYQAISSYSASSYTDSLHSLDRFEASSKLGTEACLSVLTTQLRLRDTKVFCLIANTKAPLLRTVPLRKHRAFVLLALKASNLRSSTANHYICTIDSLTGVNSSSRAATSSRTYREPQPRHGPTETMVQSSAACLQVAVIVVLHHHCSAHVACEFCSFLLSRTRTAATLLKPWTHKTQTYQTQRTQRTPSRNRGSRV